MPPSSGDRSTEGPGQTRGSQPRRVRLYPHLSPGGPGRGRRLCPLRLRLYLVAQTRVESQRRHLPAVSLRPASEPLVRVQLAPLLLAWLSWDLLPWGRLVFWARQGSQLCLALSSYCSQVGLGGAWGPHWQREACQLLSLFKPTGQGSPSPSSSVLLKQDAVLSTRSPVLMARWPQCPQGQVVPWLPACRCLSLAPTGRPGTSRALGEGGCWHVCPGAG